MPSKKIVTKPTTNRVSDKLNRADKQAIREAVAFEIGGLLEAYFTPAKVKKVLTNAFKEHGVKGKVAREATEYMAIRFVHNAFSINLLDVDTDTAEGLAWPVTDYTLEMLDNAERRVAGRRAAKADVDDGDDDGDDDGE